MHKLFTVCTEQVRPPYIDHAVSGLPNPTHLEGEIRFDLAKNQQVVTTRSPRIVTLLWVDADETCRQANVLDTSFGINTCQKVELNLGHKLRNKHWNEKAISSVKSWNDSQRILQFVCCCCFCCCCFVVVFFCFVFFFFFLFFFCCCFFLFFFCFFQHFKWRVVSDPDIFRENYKIFFCNFFTWLFVSLNDLAMVKMSCWMLFPFLKYSKTFIDEL